jgi:hypothetical protein
MQQTLEFWRNDDEISRDVMVGQGWRGVGRPMNERKSMKKRLRFANSNNTNNDLYDEQWHQLQRGLLG